MSDKQPKPGVKLKRKSDQAEERLAAALRENLRRRKSQERARADTDAEAGPEPGDKPKAR